MTKTTWFDDEARAVDFVRQGADLLVRGARRPFMTLFFALLFASIVAAALAFGKRSYSPRLVLRLLEGEGDPTAQPHLKRRLADYVRDGIFTSEPLLDVMRRHALYPTLLRNDPHAALEAFREDTHVEVYQNYFVEQREPGKSPRSARVAVSFHAPDRDKALAVTRDLGALIVEHETRVRRDQAERAAGDADRTRDALRVALQRRVREVAELRNDIAESPPDPARQVELVGLLGSLANIERDLDGATRQAATFELGAALEQGGVGLRFEVADEASLPNSATRLHLISFVALASFVIGLPLAAAAVGAFSPPRRA